MQVDDQPVGLAAAIAELRSELSRARREGENEDIRLAVGEIEVELGVEFAWTREGSGGIKLFSFLELKGKTGSNEKSSHRLRLKLQIADPNDAKTKHREIASRSSDSKGHPVVEGP
jgi:Trypsin-co-occurring domain 2